MAIEEERAEAGGRQWRFIHTGPLDGPLNMAVDEALLLSFDPESSLPVFRIYGWEPPAFSLGRFQEASSVLNLEMCSRDGLPVVRRMTGGGAIYHADEITYSIICRPDDIAAAGTVKESFRMLTSFLLRFYALLGLEAGYAVEQPGLQQGLGQRTPFCFAGREEYDIIVGGRKIGGNAQKRLRNAIFQHGSIPLENRTATGALYLKHQPDALDCGTVSLRQLGTPNQVPELIDLLKSSFAEAMKTSLLEGDIFGEEKDKAGSLLLGKYRSEAWNCSGMQG